MIADVPQMACGGCGCGTFRCYYNYPTERTGIFLECTDCKSVSKIAPVPARVEIEHIDGDGTLCKMRPTKS